MKNKLRINNQIRSPKVRIVGDDIESRIVDIKEAISISDEMDLDLVEIVPNANPPVCKITDFKKFLYEIKQKKKEMEKQQRKNAFKVKEIRFTYNTGDHDFNFKLNHAKKFLSDGDKVKAFVWFSGREINFKEAAELLLLKFVDSLEDVGKVDNMPKLDGRKLWVLISPKK